MMNKYILLLFCSLSFFACDDSESSNLKEKERINILPDKMLVERNIQNIYALCYPSEASLPDIVVIPVNSEGGCVLNKPTNDYHKYLLIGGENIDIKALSQYNYDQIKQLTTAISDYDTMLPELYWSAEFADSADMPVVLKKSVYRIDIQMKAADLRLDSCVIEQVPNYASFISGGNIDENKVLYQSARLDFTKTSHTNNQINAFIGYESEIVPLIRLYVCDKGVSRTVEMAIPSAVERNKIYELSLNEVGGEIKTSLHIRDWENGGSTIVGPEPFKYQIDKTKSVLPAFVRISAMGDTLFVPSCNTDLILAIDADVEADIKIQGAPLSIERVVNDDYLGNQFRINFAQKDVLKSAQITNLLFAEKGTSAFEEKGIVVVQEPARLNLTSTNVTTNGTLILYSDYIDGTLATVKPGYNVSSYDIGSDGEQYQWVMLLRKGGKFSVEGAFKPNDREAEGQRQESTISIRYTDDVEEEYTFSRIRISLPVVPFNGKYWSKYNMRGNSKDIGDQIGFKDDQANLWDYLKSCNDEAFLFYAGNEYAGVNSNGLRLSKNAQGKLTYEGYWDAFGAGTIADAKADSHCPPGYEVPTEEDVRSIIGSSVVHLYPLQKGHEETDAYLVDKQRYTVDRYRRNTLHKDGVAIDDVYHLKITNTQGESIVLNGLGFQAEPNSVAWGYWLFANVTASKRFVGFNHKGNNFYMQSHSGKKTNLVRCVKKPVSYVL